MQVNTISKVLSELNRVHLMVQLVPENSKESEAISKVSTGNASDAQKNMVEESIERFCTSMGEHFILISAKVNRDGMTDILLEHFGAGV